MSTATTTWWRAALVPVALVLLPFLALARGLASAVAFASAIARWAAAETRALVSLAGADDAPLRNLDAYRGSSSAPTWAVVTGASSGVGEAVALELAANGFSVVLVARREDRLRDVARRVEEAAHPRVRAVCLPFDLSDAFARRDELLAGVDRVTGSGDVGLVAHFAGNSDLAVHLTDKPLARNVELLRLNVESTLVVVQLFLERLARRSARGAIVTSGALTAFAAVPGFACSSANKHFIRALTTAAAHEFRDHVDLVAAHPIAVRSEILSNAATIPAAIGARAFARGALAALGDGSASTCGDSLHQLVVDLMLVLPESLVRAVFARSLGTFSVWLERPIDEAPLKEKLLR